jgi:DNA polymerase/3'-5' exonuclease PolX
MKELRERALKINNPYKAMSFQKAITSVESYPFPITSGNEMMQLPGIGVSTAAKIQEIIDTVCTTTLSI